MPGNLQKTCSAKEKSKKTPNTQRQKGFDEKKIKIIKEKTQRPTNHQTKENVQNQIKEIENKFKISINTVGNLRETRAIAAIKKTPKYFNKFVKKQLNDQSWNWTSPRWRGEPGTKQPKNERTTEWIIQ